MWGFLPMSGNWGCERFRVLYHRYEVALRKWGENNSSYPPPGLVQPEKSRIALMAWQQQLVDEKTLASEMLEAHVETCAVCNGLKKL